MSASKIFRRDVTRIATLGINLEAETLMRQYNTYDILLALEPFIIILLLFQSNDKFIKAISSFPARKILLFTILHWQYYHFRCHQRAGALLIIQVGSSIPGGSSSATPRSDRGRHVKTIETKLVNSHNMNQIKFKYSFCNTYYECVFVRYLNEK